LSGNDLCTERSKLSAEETKGNLSARSHDPKGDFSIEGSYQKSGYQTLSVVSGNEQTKNMKVKIRDINKLKIIKTDT